MSRCPYCGLPNEPHLSQPHENVSYHVWCLLRWGRALAEAASRRDAA